jgi:hypothetical protein
LAFNRFQAKNYKPRRIPYNAFMEELLKCASCGIQLSEAEIKAKAIETHRLCDTCFKIVVAEMSRE